MTRLIWLLIGYLCGSIQTGYLLGKLKGIDVRDYGSHSTGATNSLRVMGTGAGILVLLGDALKAILPCVAVRCLYGNDPDLMMVLLLWTGAGVMLGHCYPFYLGFRGGKGVAITVGLLLVISPPAFLIWVAVFFLVLFPFHYVSLSSISAMAFLAVLLIVLTVTGKLPVGEAVRTEVCLVGLFLPLFSIWRHRANIGRLMNGTESKLKFFTKGSRS